MIRAQETVWHCGMCGLRFTAQPAVDHVCARWGGCGQATWAGGCGVTLATETGAFQIALEALRAARELCDQGHVDDEFVTDCQENLGRARRAMEIAYLNHGQAL